MVKKLTRTGGNLALVLDETMLEALGVDDQTPLEVSTDGGVLLVTPLRDKAPNAKLEELVEEMNDRYGGVFRRLAE